MKRFIYILIVGLVVLLCSYSLLSDGEDLSKKVNQSIVLGQESGIVEAMSSDVLLNIQGVESNYTKQQADQVLHEFFRLNRPAQFLCTSGHSLISGKLTTSDGKCYNVEYTIRIVNNQEFITGLYIH